jgi:exosortase B
MASLPQSQPMPMRVSGSLVRWWPVACGLALLYVPTWVDLAHGLWKEEPYAHGPLILLVVAWLVWRNRQALAEEFERPAPVAGSLALGFGLLLYAVGRSQAIALFEVGSHLPVVAGLLLLVGGWRLLRVLWFPLAFLVFLVPLPGFILEAATAPLKNFVSQAVEMLLYWAGYPIARSGVVLAIGNYQLLMADACSGLNSLYSLAALGCLYLYLTPGAGLFRKAMLLASILPIAVIANVLRVLALVLITFHYGDEAGQSFLHEFAGLALFVSALAMLFGLDTLLARIPGLQRREAIA